MDGKPISPMAAWPFPAGSDAPKPVDTTDEITVPNLDALTIRVAEEYVGNIVFHTGTKPGGVQHSITFTPDGKIIFSEGWDLDEVAREFFDFMERMFTVSPGLGVANQRRWMREVLEDYIPENSPHWERGKKLLGEE